MELLRLNVPAYFAPEKECKLSFYLDPEIEHYFVVGINGQIAGSQYSSLGEGIRLVPDGIHEVIGEFAVIASIG